jgi:HK97 gp10 family phage protein
VASRNVDVAVRVDGLRELRRNLKAIDSRAPRELNKEAKKVGQKVADRAAHYAPKDTGTLANSIKVGSRGDKITVRSPLPYAAPIHWGWPSRGIRPQPFIARAAEEKREEYAEELQEAMNRLIGRYHLDPRGL